MLSRPADGPDLVLRYADHADGLVDVFLPPALGMPDAPSPLVVLVHGGFWRQEFDRTHLRPLAGWLARDGFVVATPEYCRTGIGGRGSGAGDGSWPDTSADIETAVAAIPGLIDGAAPGRIEATTPCVLAGHSAGGHLALWAGLRAGPSVVRHVVALAPVASLVTAARDGLDGDAVAVLLGGGPDDVPEAYADADPWGQPSGHVRVTIVHGADDVQVPVALSRQVAKDHHGITFFELPGVEHFALIDPLSAAFRDHVLPALRH